MRKLLRGEVLRTEVTLAQAGDELLQGFEASGHAVKKRADVVVVEIEGEKQVGDVLRVAIEAGAQVIEVVPRRETLEDLFMRRAL